MPVCYNTEGAQWFLPKRVVKGESQEAPNMATLSPSDSNVFASGSSDLSSEFPASQSDYSEYVPTQSQAAGTAPTDIHHWITHKNNNSFDGVQSSSAPPPSGPPVIQNFNSGHFQQGAHAGAYPPSHLQAAHAYSYQQGQVAYSYPHNGATPQCPSQPTVYTCQPNHFPVPPHPLGHQEIYYPYYHNSFPTQVPGEPYQG